MISELRRPQPVSGEHVWACRHILSDRQERTDSCSLCHHTLIPSSSSRNNTIIHQIQTDGTSTLKHKDCEHRPGPNRLFWALNIAFLIWSHANIFPDTCYNGKTRLWANLCGTHIHSPLAGSRCPIFCPDKFSIWHQLHDRKAGNWGLNT